MCKRQRLLFLSFYIPSPLLVKELFSFWHLPFPLFVTHVEWPASWPTSFRPTGLDIEANFSGQETHPWTQWRAWDNLLSNRAKQMVRDGLARKVLLIYVGSLSQRTNGELLKGGRICQSWKSAQSKVEWRRGEKQRNSDLCTPSPWAIFLELFHFLVPDFLVTSIHFPNVSFSRSLSLTTRDTDLYKMKCQYT